MYNLMLASQNQLVELSQIYNCLDLDQFGPLTT